MRARVSRREYANHGYNSDSARECGPSVLSNNRPQAVTLLSAIDLPALVQLRADLRNGIWAIGGLATGYKSRQPGTIRQYTRTTDKRFTFERDRYTCRYLHCRRRTVDPGVLRLLSQAFPDLVPYHPNWRPVETHILYWTFTTSLEHLVPFPAGGTSDRENLITPCYMCNDAKNRVPHTVLGWDVVPTTETRWLGLTEYIPELRKAIKDLGPR